MKVAAITAAAPPMSYFIVAIEDPGLMVSPPDTHDERIDQAMYFRRVLLGSGDPLGSDPRLTMGPLKIISADTKSAGESAAV